MEVIRIYEVYIDVYFIENALLDAQVLVFVLLLLKERIVIWRLAAASVTGGIGAALILLAGVNYGIIYVCIVLLLDFVMIYISVSGKFRQKADFRKLIMGVIYFHGMVFAYGKLTECAVRLGLGTAARVAVAVIVLLAVLFMAVYHKVKEQKQLYDVVLIQNGNNIELKALFDTGNLLIEPISGKQVSVL